MSTAAETNGVESPKTPTKMEIDRDLDLNVSVSEISKGGIKYEVILGEQKVQKVVTPTRCASPATTPTPAISAEMIQLKINAAAERRQSLEAERLSALALKFRKVEEVVQKNQVEKIEFINSTKENLEKRIKTHIDNRESRIADLKTKLNSHTVGRLQEVKHNFESSIAELKKEVETKLETAEKNREKMFQEKLESLKKHDEKVEMIRKKRNSLGETKVDQGMEGVEEVKPEN